MRWVLLLLLITACADVREVRVTRAAMGTDVTIIAYHEDRRIAAEAVNLAFDEISRLEKIFGPTNGTAVSQLNTEGFLADPPPELLEVLRLSQQYSNASAGSFDITVQPVLDLYKYTFEQFGRPPNETEIQDALRHVGYQNVIVNENVTLLNDARITVGGIAKGYIVDKASDVLRSQGISHGLVNGGGDIMAIGGKPDGSPWTVALQNPRNRSDYVAIIEIQNKAVATSGDYERYFVNKTYHHIIAPNTGRSADEMISVTVVSNSAVSADAIATAAFVAGHNGRWLIESLGSEGLIIDANRTVMVTRGFREKI
ncbi:MAG: FAD:protein FMN transferase [archaeon]